MVTFVFVVGSSTVVLSHEGQIEGGIKIGSVERMPENPKLVVHMMLKRGNYPTSGWTIEDRRPS